MTAIARTISAQLKRHRSLADHEDTFVRFFSKAIERAADTERTYFGSSKNSVSLLAGSIYLAAWVTNGKDRGLWMLVDDEKCLGKIRSGIVVKRIKSTKNSSPALYWVHTEDAASLGSLLANRRLWASYEAASRKVFETRHGKFSRRDQLEGKEPISVFFESSDIEKEARRFEAEVTMSRSGSREERLARLRSADSKPRLVTMTGTVHQRNPDVVAEVLHRADGRCERCGRAAPFLRKDGSPYLEVHHKVFLSKNGEDTVENALALCPNCHRFLHHGVPGDTEGEE